MRLRIKFSISLNEPDDAITDGPEHEAQIGHLADAGHVDTGMGFVPPGPKLDEAWDD